MTQEESQNQEQNTQRPELESPHDFARVDDGFERLWTPHRMAYINGERPTEHAGEGCPFCSVTAKNDAEGLIVHRGESCYVVMNLFPYNPGHAMVAPVAHVPGLEALDDAQTTLLMRGVRRTIDVLRGTLKPEGFNVGVNMGRAAGAGIPDHVHFHVVPRWNGDTNFMPVIDDVKVVNEALTQTAAKLREAFAKS